MQHRFGHRPEDQAHAHAGAEQHGNPRGKTEFRFLVGTPELEGAVAAEGDVQQHAEHAADQGNVEPLEVVEDGVRGTFEHAGRLIAVGGAQDHEGEDDQQRPDGHHGVEVLEQAGFCTHRLSLLFLQGRMAGGMAC
ncbi:hypothetical protein D3C73_1315640 [compost metagenome]